MKPTPLLIALGLFIILAGFVYYTGKNPSDVDDESQPILQIETNEIQSITILRPGYDSITIRQNEESGWVFGNPHNAIRTDTAAANMIATNLTELSADRIRSWGLRSTSRQRSCKARGMGRLWTGGRSAC